MLSFFIALFSFASPLTYTRVEAAMLPKVSPVVTSASSTPLIQAHVANQQKTQRTAITTEASTKTVLTAAALSVVATSTIPSVPFYSQFTDIASPTWQKVGCGITDVAMLVDYYTDKAPTVETLLSFGIAAGAYTDRDGWIYSGLIGVAKKYGLDGASYDLGNTSPKTAFTQFKKYLADGPVIASVHYNFDPKSTIPHLVVINGIKDNVIYYNDPAAKTGEKTISTTDFLKGWKKRFIVLRPTKESGAVALAD